MLSFQVFLLKSDCSQEWRTATLNSIRFAASESVSLVECEQAKLGELIEASTADVIHIVLPGTILMPEFYRAMLMTLEHEGSDYVACHEGVLLLKAIVKAGEKDFDPSQVLVRKWVYHEMGVGKENPANLVNKVVGEYRGSEVPHLLCMKVTS